MSGEAAGEIWNWLLLGVGLMHVVGKSNATSEPASFFSEYYREIHVSYGNGLVAVMGAARVGKFISEKVRLAWS